VHATFTSCQRPRAALISLDAVRNLHDSYRAEVNCSEVTTSRLLLHVIAGARECIWLRKVDAKRAQQSPVLIAGGAEGHTGKHSARIWSALCGSIRQLSTTAICAAETDLVLRGCHSRNHSRDGYSHHGSECTCVVA
jgi:hypothetical protein